jgi:hypothetical protein
LHILNKNTKIGVFNVIPDSKDDFFEATQQIKSVMENLPEAMRNFVVFPIMVFDGEIYEFYEENETLKILPNNHVQYVLFGTELAPCIVDVVRKSYFSEFLKDVQNDIQILGEIADYERQLMKGEEQR